MLKLREFKIKSAKEHAVVPGFHLVSVIMDLGEYEKVYILLESKCDFIIKYN